MFHCESKHVRIFSVMFKISISKETLILMDPCIVSYSVEIPTICSFVIEFIISKFFEVSACFERHTGVPLETC